MGVPQAREILRERAESIRDSLHKNQTITDSMVAILGSFDHRLSALETAMRPTQIRTHSIRRAHESIDKTLKAAEVILGQFDLTRKGIFLPARFCRRGLFFEKSCRSHCLSSLTRPNSNYYSSH